MDDLEKCESKKDKEEKIKKVKKALSISISGAQIPTKETMKEVRKYIEGKEQLADIQKKIIEEYKENDR